MGTTSSTFNPDNPARGRASQTAWTLRIFEDFRHHGNLAFPGFFHPSRTPKGHNTSLARCKSARERMIEDSLSHKGRVMTSIGVFAAIFDEQGRILCVKRNYPPFTWTTPGGGMDHGESLMQAVEREVREETGYIVRAKRLLGAYSSTYKDDLVLSVEADIVDPGVWQPSQEISEMGFFTKEQLPQPMKSGTTVRIFDAFNKDAGVMRVFDSA